MEEKNFEPEAGNKRDYLKHLGYKTDVPNVPPNDLASIASHSCTFCYNIELWNAIDRDEQELILQKIVDEINTSPNLHSRYVLRKIIEQK